MFQSTGTLKYDPIFWSAKLYLNDKEIATYYRSLVPKSLYINPTKYDPHITIVRIGKEHVPNKDEWFKYQNTTIKFWYDPRIRIDETYAWLDCYSKQLREIRRGLGLPSTRFANSHFHITIGNFKNA